MMQDGLHIGLAAWINAQRNSGSFAVCPASPIVMELVNLEAIQNTNDLSTAAEFARLVNFIPRQGQVADVFSSSAVLWNVHRDILSRMSFATEPWTSAERAQYQAARDVLYTADGSGRPTPSDKLQLYTEMKHAYDDVRISGGCQADIDHALSNWTVMGYKNEVENALAAMVRLSNRSSRTQAEIEQASLQDDRLRVSGELTFAPTYLAPLSALARQTWMEASVSFDDLNRAVANGPAGAAWKAYLANRTGEVSFNYVVIHCLRPWYTPGLYQADDWTLNAEGALVSRGNGIEGELPAYVDALYLVSVKDVRIRPAPLPPPPIPRRPIPLRLGRSAISAAEACFDRPMVRPGSLGLTGRGKEVVTGAANNPTGATSARVSATVLASGATDVQFTALSSGAVRRLTTVDLTRRYSLAQAYLARQRPADVSTSSEDTTIYVAGFGCAKIPFTPNPNVNYKWS